MKAIAVLTILSTLTLICGCTNWKNSCKPCCPQRCTESKPQCCCPQPHVWDDKCCNPSNYNLR